MFARKMGERAELRPLEPYMNVEFAAHMDRAREHIRPWVGQSFVTADIAGATGTLEKYAQGAAQDSRRLYGIWVDGTLVGGVMFTSFSTADGNCEVGCWLEPGFQGQGLVTQAISLLADWAFLERGMERVEWLCRADNERSSAVARRLGMTLEGTVRSNWVYDGQRYDMQIWSLLKSEWKAER